MTEPDYISTASQTLACTAVEARRVAAMLDLDSSSLAKGSDLPVGWHFFLLAGETQRSSLRPDGFPGSGISLPDVDFSRLVLGGREVQYSDSIPIGADVRRDSSLQLTHKDTAKGSMAIAKFQHSLRQVDAPAPAILETQTYILLSEGPRRSAQVGSSNPMPIQADVSRVILLDEIALFQYSALGFNSHRIHVDRHYACDVEGYPDLVVNGGLTTIHLTELLRNEIGVQPKAIKVRHLAPLYCGRPISLAASRDGDGWILRAHDEKGAVAVEASVMVQ